VSATFFKIRIVVKAGKGCGLAGSRLVSSIITLGRYGNPARRELEPQMQSNSASTILENASIRDAFGSTLANPNDPLAKPRIP
jgi:hypothetical protein